MLVEFLRPALYIWALRFERTIGIKRISKIFCWKILQIKMEKYAKTIYV